MTTHPKLRVTKDTVEAAQAEVAAFEAAGIADRIDPMVRRIAQARPVPVTRPDPTPEEPVTPRSHGRTKTVLFNPKAGIIFESAQVAFPKRIGKMYRSRNRPVNQSSKSTFYSPSTKIKQSSSSEITRRSRQIEPPSM